MPELPEVETIRRGLEGLILQQKMTEVEVMADKSWEGEFVPGVVTGLSRRGKALIINLDNGTSLMIHLRMTGQLILDAKERFGGGHPSENFVAELPNQQTRVVMKFASGDKLFFNDQRKFGFIKVLKTTEVEKDPFIAKLGKEPWQMTVKELQNVLMRHKNAPVKAVLLDQSNIAGLGNIYADEALFAAKIHPKTKAGKITATEAEALLMAARAVMEKSIAAGGSTIRNYVKADGTRGDYLDLFAKVYGRAGRPCARCGAELIKTKVAGRGTHICPNCQKEKND